MLSASGAGKLKKLLAEQALDLTVIDLITANAIVCRWCVPLRFPGGEKSGNAQRHPNFRTRRRLHHQAGEEGTPAADICRKAGISQAIYFNWKKKYARMPPIEMKQLEYAASPTSLSCAARQQHYCLGQAARFTCSSVNSSASRDGSSSFVICSPDGIEGLLYQLGLGGKRPEVDCRFDRQAQRMERPGKGQSRVQVTRFPSEAQLRWA